MLTSVIGDEVRTHVRDLGYQVDQQTAEAVALAMLTGTAQGFLELVAARAGDREDAVLRVMLALPIAREHVLLGAFRLRDS